MAIALDRLLGAELMHGPSDLLALPSMARLGLLPGCEVERLGLPGGRTYGGAQRSRDGHVYLGRPEYIVANACNNSPVLRIDPAQLDPALVSADEDHFAIYTFRRTWDGGALAKVFPDYFGEKKLKDGRRRISWRTGTDLSCPPTWHRSEKLDHGAWAAKNAHFLGREDVSSYSIARGSIAYAGPVPPEALTIAHEQLGQALKYQNSRLSLATARAVIEALLLLEPDADLRAQHARRLVVSSFTVHLSCDVADQVLRGVEPLELLDQLAVQQAA